MHCLSLYCLQCGFRPCIVCPYIVFSVVSDHTLIVLLLSSVFVSTYIMRSSERFVSVSPGVFVLTFAIKRNCIVVFCIVYNSSCHRLHTCINFLMVDYANAMHAGMTVSCIYQL